MSELPIEKIKIFNALKTKNRIKLLQYFKENDKLSYSEIKEKTKQLTDCNLVFHLNVLLSAGLILNTAEKKSIGRQQYSYYSITELGLKALEML